MKKARRVAAFALATVLFTSSFIGGKYTGLLKVEAGEVIETLDTDIKDVSSVSPDASNEEKQEYTKSYLLPTDEQVEAWIEDGSWEDRVTFMSSLSENQQITTYNVSGEIKLKDMVHATPSTGNVKVPVFLVEFQDCKNEDAALTAETIKENLFGDGDENNYPYESLANYYERSSYGKLNLSGDVYDWFELSHEKDYYTSSDDILEEVMSAFDEQIDYTQYDSDSDGYIDGVYIMYAGDSGEWGTMYWSYKTSAPTGVVYDGVNVNNYLFQFTESYVITAIHETGHMLGLPDYYNYNDAGVSIRDSYGEIGGVGFFDMMDNNIGDHNLFSKLLLGWVEPEFVTSDSEIDLISSDNENVRAVIVSPDGSNSIYGEYYLVELYSNKGNNKTSLKCDNGAVRIYHVKADIEEYWDTGYYWFLYNNMYEDVSEYKLLKLLESDGTEENSLNSAPITADKYYYEGMEFGVNTVPSSEFYGGIYTGINISVNKVGSDTAKISVRFAENDNTKPEVIDVGSYNILGKVGKLSNYKIYFNGYIYEDENFTGIKCYEKNSPQDMVDINVSILNPHKSKLPESKVIFSESRLNYNAIVISSTATLKSNTEYVIEIPAGAVKDAYGNTNEMITQTFTTLKVTDKITEMDYGLKTIPEDAPEGYYLKKYNSIKSLLLNDGTIFFADSGAHDDRDSKAVLVIKRFSQSGEQLLNHAIVLNGLSWENQYVIKLYELENGNIAIVFPRIYVVVDKEGNVISESKLDRFIYNSYITIIERNDYYDIYNVFDPEKVIYRIHKLDGTLEILDEFAQEIKYVSYLMYCDDDYTKVDWDKYYKDRYNVNEDFYRLNISKYINYDYSNVPFYNTENYIRVRSDVFGDKDRFLYNVDKFKSYTNAFTSVGKVQQSVQLFGSDYYRMMQIIFAGDEGTLPTNCSVEVEGDEGYITSIAAVERTESNTHHYYGSYLIRWDKDFNVKWVALIEDISGVINKAMYQDGKITVIVSNDILIIEDTDETYVSSEKSFCIEGYKVNQDKMTVGYYDDITVEGFMEHLKGEYKNIKFYDKDMRQTTDKDVSLVGGMVEITDINEMYTWYYKIQKTDRTIESSEGIIISIPEESTVGDVTLISKALSEEEKHLKINLDGKIADTSISAGEVKFVAHDISLEDLDNNTIEPSEKVTVKIPCPDGYDGEACKVYYVDNNGRFEDMNAVLEDGYLSFETTHFSIYMVTETELLTGGINYGDVNGDGNIDTQDAVLLKKYLAGYTDLGIDEDACDVNKDGSIDSADAVILLKHLAGYEGMLQ